MLLFVYFNVCNHQTTRNKPALYHLKIKDTQRGFQLISADWLYIKYKQNTAKEIFDYVWDGVSYFNTFYQAKSTCNEIFDGVTSNAKDKKVDYIVPTNTFQSKKEKQYFHTLLEAKLFKIVFIL
jgi:hypothetical protein